MSKYNYCIPMPRKKMRKVLARELYGDGIGDLYLKLSALSEKIGVPLTVDKVNEIGVSIYLHEYYPGKYRPYIEESGLT